MIDCLERDDLEEPGVGVRSLGWGSNSPLVGEYLALLLVFLSFESPHLGKEPGVVPPVAQAGPAHSALLSLLQAEYLELLKGENS